MVELFILLGKFVAFGTLAMTLFWFIQIRFGSIDDLDPKSRIVLLLRRSSEKTGAPPTQDAASVIAVDTQNVASLDANAVDPKEDANPPVSTQNLFVSSAFSGEALRLAKQSVLIEAYLADVRSQRRKLRFDQSTLTSAKTGKRESPEMIYPDEVHPLLEAITPETYTIKQ